MSDKVFADPTWAIVELFGRQVIAGQISEVTIAGSDMLRIDVPPTMDIAGYTKFFGNGAIYAITPTDKLSAIHAVAHLHVRPVSEWTIPVREIPATVDDEEDEQLGFHEENKIDF